MASSMSISQLPNELVSYILNFLDEPSIFEQYQYDDPAHIPGPNDVPSPDSFRGTIKSASLVCRLWRRCTLPLLFRTIIWRFQHMARPSSGEDPLSTVEELEFLRFLVMTGLARYVDSLSIIIDYPVTEIGEDFNHHANWGILPSHCPALIHQGPGGDLVAAGPSYDNNSKSQSNNWLWQTIFEHLNLLTINLISSPAILASLLGRPINLSGCWIYRQRFHFLSLSRSADSRHQATTPSSNTTALANTSFGNRAQTTVPCSLFSIRPWDSMLLNEGSSVKVYATYEYFNHVPPSILPALLDSGDESMQYLLRNSLRSLSYVAIFPLATHINDVLIPRVPALEKFYIQIVPRAPSFAEDDYRHPAMDISDLWMERNTAYAQLVMAIFDPPPLGSWSSLQYFESGDAVDREAWEQAVRYVIFAAGATWKVAGEGKFVRRNEKVPMAVLQAS
ncbi:F-box domain-containing protein [Trichoderma harzianum]|uniref:F-box domain-containing protein n=1 Tax=Trichoderma harzianum TaxID=5544 RepID=A0A0F9XVM6_TRIHA|nr:F-box domain-containing protein [Trichoderma harzianum]